MDRAPFSVIGLLLFACLATSPSRSDELKDLYFGEALYYAHQGYFFEALERLDTEVKQHDELDEPELDTLYYHINDAEFSLGDFELRYRMHHRAGRAIKAVLEGAVDEIVRNDAAYRLDRATGAMVALSGAQDLSGDEMRSLDGQVQEIKSDVLSIASELSNLEERLLYPSNTEIAIFVSIADDEAFRLDAVQIEINGELATHHIYSFKELEALQKGGVQRIYTGNIVTGDHELSVTMIGKLKSGKDFNESDSFVFAKGVKPKTLGITLAGPEFGKSGIQIGDW